MEAQDHRLDPIVIGALFKNTAELKVVCQNAATSGNFEYSIIKSDRTRLTIKCSADDCPWRMHASRIGDSKDGIFEIKTMGEAHKCIGNQNLGHRQVSAEFISLKIQQKLRENPSYRPKDIQQD